MWGPGVGWACSLFASAQKQACSCTALTEWGLCVPPFSLNHAPSAHLPAPPPPSQTHAHTYAHSSAHTHSHAHIHTHTHTHACTRPAGSAYPWVVQLPVAVVSLDFLGVPGAAASNRTLELVATHGFPAGKTLGAGIVDGRSVWADTGAQVAAGR